MIKVNGDPINVTLFPDNTNQVWKLPIARYVDSLHRNGAVNVEWKYEHQGEIMELVQLNMLLKAYGVDANLDIKYLPYARQDKPISNDATFAMYALARVFNTLEWASVKVLDPHSETALDLIKITNGATAYYPIEQLFRAVVDTHCDTICFADKNAYEKYRMVYRYDMHSLYGTKERDPSTGMITHYTLDGDPKGRRVMIVDDICDGGATFVLLANKLNEGMANDVSLFVTHGIFSKGVRRLFGAGISRIFTAEREVTLREGSNNV